MEETTGEQVMDIILLYLFLLWGAYILNNNQKETKKLKGEVIELRKQLNRQPKR